MGPQKPSPFREQLQVDISSMNLQDEKKSPRVVPAKAE
jgi:hypothetical protein